MSAAAQGASAKRDAASPLINGVHRTRLPEYRIWAGLKSRCNNRHNPNFDRYGGRGISVCDRWSDFAAFYADMGRRPTARHSIDRIDNDGNYEPGNCRWATAYEQAVNKRLTPKDDKWTEREVSTLRTMFAGHYHIDEIAKVIGRTPATVRLRAHNLGLRRDGRFTILCRKHPDLAPTLRDRGADAFLTALANKIDAQKSAEKASEVAKSLRKSALIAEVMSRQDDRNAKMRALRLAGLKLEEIGKLFGVTRERVRQLQSRDFAAQGCATSARKIYETRPQHRIVHINRLIRAWNRASADARQHFLSVASESVQQKLPVLGRSRS